MRCDTISAQAGPLSQCLYKNLGKRDLASLKRDSCKPDWPASHMRATSKMYENNIRDSISSHAQLTGRARLI